MHIFLFYGFSLSDCPLHDCSIPCCSVTNFISNNINDTDWQHLRMCSNLIDRPMSLVIQDRPGLSINEPRSPVDHKLAPHMGILSLKAHDNDKDLKPWHILLPTSWLQSNVYMQWPGCLDISVTNPISITENDCIIMALQSPPIAISNM